MTKQVETKDYFNFTGAAPMFINDIRVIQPTKKGKDNFVSIKGVILEGETDNPEKISVDLIASSEEVKEVLRETRNLWPTYQEKDSLTWFASVRIGSIRPKLYEASVYENGEDTGRTETRCVLAGRLTKFIYLKVGDNVINLPANEKKAENGMVQAAVKEQAPQKPVKATQAKAYAKQSQKTVQAQHQPAF